MRRLRVLTWHVHGNYLLNLSRAPVDFLLPVKAGSPPGYGGRGSTFPFGDNVHDVPAEEVRDTQFDCVLYQTRQNYQIDGPEILSDEQRRRPRIYVQHDPPWNDPVNEQHWFDDPEGLLVHVTPFNALMWDSGRTPTRVIDHGVWIPEGIRYTGDLARGLVVINHLQQRGRRLGADVFEQARMLVALDLVGMESERMGGLGEVFPPQLPAFESQYRFLFNPIRWTSLGLAVIEAMTIGMPVVGLATTEMASAIENGVSGFVNTDLRQLIEPMHDLLRDPELARRLGAAARRTALARFHIDRFVREWEQALEDVTGRPCAGRTAVMSSYRREKVGAS